VIERLAEFSSLSSKVLLKMNDFTSLLEAILCSVTLRSSSFLSAMMQARRNLISVVKRGRFFSASIDPTKTEVTKTKSPKVY
jgi:hypothetical protein